MKSKDQVLMEEAYNQVVLNELSYKGALKGLAVAGVAGAMALQGAQAKEGAASPDVEQIMKTTSSAQSAYDEALKMVEAGKTASIKPESLKSIISNPELKTSLVRAILMRGQQLPELLKTADVQKVYPGFKIDAPVGP